MLETATGPRKDVMDHGAEVIPGLSFWSSEGSRSFEWMFLSRLRQDKYPSSVQVAQNTPFFRHGQSVGVKIRLRKYH